MARGIVPGHNLQVPGDDANPLTSEDRPILPWKIVAGVFVHFVVPIYLVALVIDTLLAMPSGATIEAMLRHALPFSGWFLAIYGLVALAVSLAAAAIDPLLRARRRQRTRNDPQAATRLSEQRVGYAVRRGRGLFGSHADTILTALGAARWDHGDPRYRALSGDLEEVVRTSADAPGEEIAATTTRALQHLQDALRELNRARDDRRMADAKAAARYVELRHGPSDFSSGGH
ncbi:hypothetical protein DMC47_37670 [Nostoc sp. 3335mG]|nr:hypothetical protein DMC47_37670 [Nostoc sp. 3335mG]